MLQKHRNAGALATTSSDNDIEKFMLPSHVKRSMLQHLIEKNVSFVNPCLCSSCVYIFALI